MRYFLTACLCFALIACGYRDRPAPVINANYTHYYKNNMSHRVVRGDTLYSIAFRYDMDYRTLAQINHIHYPFQIQKGQLLHLNGNHKSYTQYAMIKSKVSPPQKTLSTISNSWPKPHQFSNNKRTSSGWLKPADGNIISHFSPQNGRKGIDIAGRNGGYVYAAKDGVVAYSGSGIAGYGNLIIVKHNSQLLTAYGNNRRNLVKEGQKIKAGQRIAEMGIVDRRFYGVHFEIRQSGKPIDPEQYLRK